jgi:act minimal PKS acyl carrier protein
MIKLTLDDLRSLMREAAGDAGYLDGDILDVSFNEIGYDSLALLEAVARVERQYGVKIGDDAVANIESPRDFLELVNTKLAAATPTAA